MCLRGSYFNKKWLQEDLPSAGRVLKNAVHLQSPGLIFHWHIQNKSKTPNTINDAIIRAWNNPGVKGWRFLALSACVWSFLCDATDPFQNAVGGSHRQERRREKKLCRVLPVSPQETLALLDFCDDMLYRQSATTRSPLFVTP